MLKKILRLVLGCTLLLAAVGCGSSDTASGTDSGYTSAEQLLNAIWEKDTDADRPSVIGGMGESAVDGKAGSLDLEQKDILEQSFHVPEQAVSGAKSAASLMNAMMANYFTAVAVQYDSAQDAESAAGEIAESLKDARWLCGSPEIYHVFTMDRFAVYVYGLQNSVDPFLGAAEEVNPDLHSVASGTLE